jgi:hypothetical protein
MLGGVGFCVKASEPPVCYGANAPTRLCLRDGFRIAVGLQGKIFNNLKMNVKDFLIKLSYECYKQIQPNP